MARKKTTSNHGRAPGKTQISISLPEDLVNKIDKIADVENRNRSNFIATHLEQMADIQEAAEPAGTFKTKKKAAKKKGR